MKYIRTKDGIYKDKQYQLKEIAEKNGECFVTIEEKEVLKQADTIEELCDEFVLVDTETKYCGILPKDKEIKFDKVNMGNAYGRKFYGSIWTDKGLIYIAKMNDKGELELL